MSAEHDGNYSSDGLDGPARRRAAVAIWLAILIASLDVTMTMAALPTIGEALRLSPVEVTWVITAYQLGIIIMILPMAAIGEVVGFRPVYLSGIAVFVAASIVTATTFVLPALAGARFVQGMGAGAIMAVNGAMIRRTYPRALLGKGAGYNAMVIAMAAAAGPAIASTLLIAASWHWIFLVTAPAGLAALVIGWSALPSDEPTRKAIDWLSALLCAGGLALLVMGASGLIHDGLVVPSLLAWAGSAAALASLFRRSVGQPSPLLPIDLLRDRLLRLSYMTSALSFCAQVMALVSIPFLLTARLGFDLVHLAIILTAWPVATALCAYVSGQLAGRVPTSVLGATGLLLMAASLGVLAFVPASAPPWLAAGLVGGSGAGFGIFQTPNNRFMLDRAPSGRIGASGGMLAIARLIGQTCGALLVAALFGLAAPDGPLVLAGAAIAACAGAAVSISRRRAPTAGDRSAD